MKPRLREPTILTIALLGLLFGIAATGPARAAIIRNTYDHYPPVDGHHETHADHAYTGVSIWGSWSTSAAATDLYAVDCSCTRARLKVGCGLGTSGWQPQTDNYANAHAYFDLLDIECRHTSDYNLTLISHVRGNAGFAVAADGGLGGSDAELTVRVYWRIYNADSGALVSSISHDVYHYATHDTGGSNHWWSGNPLVPAYAPLNWNWWNVHLVSGVTYRMELEVEANARAGSVGASGGSNVLGLLQEETSTFGGQTYACPDCGFGFTQLTIQDVYPDNTAPLVFITPGETDHCDPISVSLTATDELGGYGVEAIYRRIGTGDWALYTAPIPVAQDVTIEYYGVDWAGNAADTQSLSYRIGTVPAAPVPTGVPDGAADVNQPVTLTWDPAADATGYRLQVDADPAFAAPSVDVVLPGTSQELPVLTEGVTYYWHVRATGNCGDGPWSTARSFATAQVSDVPSLPDRFALAQNAPNPFNPATTISYDLPSAEHVHLTIWSLAGRRVATLRDGPEAPGTHDVLWRGVDDAGRRVPSGTYLYSLEAGDFRQARRMTLLK